MMGNEHQTSKHEREGLETGLPSREGEEKAPPCAGEEALASEAKRGRAPSGQGKEQEPREEAP